MTQIKILKETSGNLASTKDGNAFYPVTTANSVYDTSTRTLKNLLDNEYDPENTDIKSNGIYAWLYNLTNRFTDCVFLNDFNNLVNKVISDESNIVSLDNKLSVFKSSLDSVALNFSNQVSNIDKKIYKPEFDSVPTRGSTKLLNSGALYAYLSKIISKNMFDIDIVTDTNNHKADNGDIVLYGGQSTDEYKFGSLYMAKVEYVRNPDSICHEKTKKTTWILLGSLLGNTDIDLSNYYNKSEIDYLIDNIEVPVNKYYAGDYINIDDNNIISAVIPETDLSMYYKKNEVYSKNEVDNLISNSGSYFAGDNIIIDGNTISAIVPSTNNFVTNKDLEIAISKIDTNKYIAGDNIRIEGNMISAILDIDSVISEDSNNPVSSKAVSKSLSTKLDTSRVSNVAITGSFNDLTDIPAQKSSVVIAGTDNVEIQETASGDSTIYKVSVFNEVDDVLVDGVSVVDGGIAKIQTHAVEVDNKDVELGYGNKSTIATINGEDITVTMPDGGKAVVENSNPNLEFGKTSTIGVIDGTSLTLTMPTVDPISVTNADASLSYSTKSKIATINGKDITVTMPATVSVVEVDNKDAVFRYGESATIATINNTPITVKMPNAPDIDTLFMSVGNWEEFKQIYSDYNSVNGTISRKANVELSFSNDIEVSEAMTLDLTNFTIHGHYHKWINNNTTTLSGTYAKFEDVYFQQGNLDNRKLFVLRGESGSSSEYNFQRCRFRDFFKSNNITIMDLNNDSRSVHVILIMCKFANDKGKNSYSPIVQCDGEDCTMLFNTTTSSQSNSAVSVSIINTLNGNKKIECYKFAVTSRSIASDWGTNDNVIHDNSMTYDTLSYITPRNIRNISERRELPSA